jgi:hypothetical protein
MNKMMWGLYTILITLMLAGACTPTVPAGALFVYDAGRGDDLLLIPNRSLYNVNEVFQRNKDLTILLYENDGTMTLIPAGDVDINILPNINQSEEVTHLPPDTNYLFRRKGQYGVEVVYTETMRRMYSVQVIDPNDIGNGYGGGGGGDDGGTGIGVDWWRP